MLDGTPGHRQPSAATTHFAKKGSRFGAALDRQYSLIDLCGSTLLNMRIETVNMHKNYNAELPVTFREHEQMPWTPNDAESHTHKATTSALKELWAKVANESLERNGDEGRAIREANAVIARQADSD
jgi:hypothetical protein